MKIEENINRTENKRKKEKKGAKWTTSWSMGRILLPSK